VIESRADLRHYNERDLAMFEAEWGPKTWLTYPTVRYQRLLRRVELAVNTRSPLLPLLKGYFTKRSVTLGFTVPPNTCGPGLSLAHWGSVIVSPQARIGERCRIHSDVNVGADWEGNAPKIGDDCWIGPGAKVFGPVVLGDRVRIGANAVVTASFPDDAVLVGSPARNVSKGQQGRWVDRNGPLSTS
jgi:serine O-acetyltransferase